MPTFQTPDPITVDIDVACGDVTVTASERTDTVVEIRPTDPGDKDDVRAAEQIRVDFVAGKLTMKQQSRGWREVTRLRGCPSIQVSIEVPAGSRVDARTAAGRVLGAGELGECDLKVSAGDIIVERPRGSVTAKTDIGSIRIGAASRGELRLETSMGNLDIGIRPGIAARLETRALCGTVQNLMEPVDKTVRDEDVVRVYARNSYGNVTIQHAVAV
ncbi:hypothetical protein IU453_14830 [Nocardia cyriacigeorgica]|uniref:hypothetical protein n=1 Tax=Nocardia cyriacigeorgica TaxID=135487 RepID=UPI001894B845|nr:hypothetical protein [Nocardia cyriacigeorgica]MBF6318037.1 hypothetical protein [Nocardia cyriacigeorgica]MBF6532817.1 hypothetical protein [Nocardia cyriacigeorgica]